MKQGTFKKMLLIATCAVITIASASLYYCFGEESCNIPTTNPEVDVCEMCGFWYVLYN